MRSLLLLAVLLIEVYCFAVNRVDRDLESDGLVRVRRSLKRLAESSSSEEIDEIKSDSSVTSEINKIATKVENSSDEDEKEASVGNKVEGSGEGSGDVALDIDGKRKARQADVIESSGLEAEHEGRVVRDAESSGEEENVRMLRDTDLGSGSDARLADLPLEETNGLFDDSLFDFNESHNVRESSGEEKETHIEASGMESNADSSTVEGSGEITSARVSREVDGSGEELESTPIRVIREGSGDMSEE